MKDATMRGRKIERRGKAYEVIGEERARLRSP